MKKKITDIRKEEIIKACEKLYKKENFKDITIKQIGEKTSFSRTSIYNYFHTKEEIFLALFQKEYEIWIDDLNKMHDENEKLSKEEFASKLAHTIEKRPTLLKLLSMNLYDMEENSRMEVLIEFKRAYGDSIKAVKKCLDKFFTILASLDPVAIDQACLDLVYNSEDPGKDILIKRIESLHGVHTIEAAAELGIGTREYELINVD